MQTHMTTPFGRRSLSLAMVARQTATQDFAASAQASANNRPQMAPVPGADGGKGPARRHRPRPLVLHALLSFHQETALALPERAPGAAQGAGAARIIVFPSNKELSLRAHGMAPATLRRHLAMLVEAGLIIRRDSPNGKRFARRGQGGAIEDAFGFDLTPLIARAEEIENLAEEVRAESRAIALLREKITLVRRDIVKMIETALEEGGVRRLGGPPEGLSGPFGALCAPCAAGRSRGHGGANSKRWPGKFTKLWKITLKRQNMRGNESHTERHLQNQITEVSDSEPDLQKGRAEASGPVPDAGRAPSSSRPERGIVSGPQSDPKPPRAFPLGMVLERLSRHSRFRAGRHRVLARSCRGGGGRCAARSAFRPTPSKRPWRFRRTGRCDRRRGPYCSAATRSNPPAAICGSDDKGAGRAFSIGPVLMTLLRSRAVKGGPERRRAG